MYYSIVTGRFYKDGKQVGCIDSAGYVAIWYGGRLWRGHRLAYHLLGVPLPKIVDHANGNTTLNAWHNLRNADAKQSAYNTRGCSKLGHLKGAFQMHNGTWYSMIRYNGKRKYLGTFPTEDAAHAAYCAAATTLHGEFANYGSIAE